MEERYPYEKRRKYPHMMPYDADIWERFIDKNPSVYEWVEYDVKVGSVPDFVTGHEDEKIQAQAPLYNKKIDVIGHVGNKIDIIELKPHGGMSALGQVRGYVTLYKRDYKPDVIPRPVLITDILTPDIEHIAYEMGVTVLIA